MASSPTVTFNLRDMVGGNNRGRRATYDPNAASPTPREPTMGPSDDNTHSFRAPTINVGSRADELPEDDAAPPAAVSESTRNESERPATSPLVGFAGAQPFRTGSAGAGSGLFKYSSGAADADRPVPRLNYVASAAAPVAAPHRGFFTSSKPSAAPTSDDVKRRFMEMDQNEGGNYGGGDAITSGRASSIGSRHQSAPQVVSSADFVPYPHVPPEQLAGSRSTSPAGGFSRPFRYAVGSRAQPQDNTRFADRDFGSVTQSVYDDDDDRRSSYTASSRHARGSALRGRASQERRPVSDRDEYDDGMSYEPVEEPNDEVPVVPVDLLRVESKAYDWSRHPSHYMILNILERRGVQPSRHAEVIEYHMARGFLDFIAVCSAGTYFIKYGHKGTAPKERFVSLRLLPADSESSRLIAYVVITIHQEGVQIVDRARLEDLVGITTGVTGNAAFERHLVHLDVIKGGYVGQHRARLSTKGAFTIWFYDRKTRRPKALPLLTTNLSAVQVWTQCMDGFLSVNSVCVQRTNVAAEMLRYFKHAQAVVNADGYESP